MVPGNPATGDLIECKYSVRDSQTNFFDFYARKIL